MPLRVHLVSCRPIGRTIKRNDLAGRQGFNMNIQTTQYVIALKGCDAYVAQESSFKLGCADCVPVLLYTPERDTALTFPSMIAASVWAFMALPFTQWRIEPL